MRRRWTVTGLSLLLAAGVAGASGCGPGAGGGVAEGAARGAAEEVAVDVVAAMGVDGPALAALGFDPADIAAADPDGDAGTGEAVATAGIASTAAPSGAPSAGPEQRAEPGRRVGERGEARRKRHQARVLMRRNTLHGEVVVQTKDGTKTVAVQRGTVTAIDGDSMTVRSTDGFTMTWRFGDKLRVVERRATVQPTDVAVGTQVGVSGAKDGDQGVARLIVVPRRR